MTNQNKIEKNIEQIIKAITALTGIFNKIPENKTNAELIEQKANEIITLATQSAICHPKKQIKCTIPTCTITEKLSRGLCKSHYMACRQRILNGKISWEILEHNGLCEKTTKPKLQEAKEHKKIDNTFDIFLHARGLIS